MRTDFLTYKYGKINWEEPVNQDLMQIDGATEYMVRVLEMLDGLYGLEGKNVADIGGSNISSAMADHYHINKMVCIDPVSLWYSDLTGTKYEKMDLIKNESFQNAWDESRYFVVDEEAEHITEAYYNKFNLILSMSTFEHVTSIKETLNNVKRMLCTGGYSTQHMNLFLVVQKVIMSTLMKIYTSIIYLNWTFFILSILIPLKRLGILLVEFKN